MEDIKQLGKVEKSNVTAVNPMEDGTCRPIKSQYHQTSAANMMYSSTYRATGVVESQIVAIDEQNKCIREDTFGTLTTDGSSPKHNNRVIKIKQATKQGFIECEIGGGILFGISDKRVETRPSNRERTDKPDSNDGEYP